MVPVNSRTSALPANAYAVSELNRRQNMALATVLRSVVLLQCVGELQKMLSHAHASTANTPALHIGKSTALAKVVSKAVPNQSIPESVQTNNSTRRAVTSIITETDTNSSLNKLSAMPSPEKKAAFAGLVATARHAVDLETELTRIRDKPTALDVLKLFTPETMHRLVFGKNGLPQHTRAISLGARYESFEASDPSFQSRVTSIMTTAATTIASILFTQDAPALLLAMQKQRQFKDFVLPDVDESAAGYAAFTENKAVIAITEAVIQLSKKHDCKTELLSLLSDYPKAWITRMCHEKQSAATEPSAGNKKAMEPKVGVRAVEKARVHSMQFGKGAKSHALPETQPTRLAGAKEVYLQEWFGDEKNIERVDQAEGGVAGTRQLNRNRSYEAYQRQMIAEGKPYYTRGHFYDRDEQKAFKDKKCQAGLCPL